MATVNYLLKGKKNPLTKKVVYKNPSSINLRFYHGKSFDFTCSTSLILDPKKWSDKKQEAKQLSDNSEKDFINTRLTGLRAEVIKRFNLDYSTGKEINHFWLKNIVESYFNRPTSSGEHELYFVPYVERFIEKAPTRILKDKTRAPKERTIERYKNTLKRLKNYEEERKKKLKLAEINLKFHKDYLTWSLSEKKYGGNTIGKDISLIKMFCREAKTDGLNIHLQIEHKDFYAPSEKTKDVYLNEEEINQIHTFDFRGNERLENTRDLFIIGLRTGLRISDLMRLSTKNLNQGIIEIESFKTEESVAIPTHSQVTEILKKRAGQFPKSISDQKFNKYVKEVCQLVGIDEPTQGRVKNSESNRKEEGVFPKYQLISSHTCRRSFASNLYGIIPTPTIMAITGHKKESTFLSYIKITPKEHAESLKNYWKKQAKENGLEEVKMKII